MNVDNTPDPYPAVERLDFSGSMAVSISQRLRPQLWRQDVIRYYEAQQNPDAPVEERRIWCPVMSEFLENKLVKATHIVPWFIDLPKMSGLIFGNEQEPLLGPSNAILLAGNIKVWFDKYKMILVPEYLGQPEMRWRAEIIYLDYPYMPVFPCTNRTEKAEDINNRGVNFCGNNRPNTRYLYFHFIIALIRLKAMQVNHWPRIWSRHYHIKPFGDVGAYINKQLLAAILAQYESPSATDEFIRTFLHDHTVERPLSMPMTSRLLCIFGRDVKTAVEDKAQWDIILADEDMKDRVVMTGFITQF